MIPYQQRETVEVFYRTFSKDPYDPKLSAVLPTEFKLNPLYQAQQHQFVADVKPDPDPPFILAGPEFNTFK